eukprot:SAG22_NODE_5097_length_1087_cov_1.018219_2_plen_208_part_01
MRVSNNGQQFGPDSETYEYYSAPHIYSIMPHVGPVRGGTRVTLFGVSFLPYADLGCIFGNVTVPAEYVNGTIMVCVSPQHLAGPVALNMTINGQQYTTDDITFNFYEIDELYPPRGPLFGETVVSIIGYGFVPTTVMSCLIDNVTILAVYHRIDLLTCLAPAHQAGTVPFEISADDGFEDAYAEDGKQYLFDDTEYTDSGSQYLYYEN